MKTMSMLDPRDQSKWTALGFGSDSQCLHEQKKIGLKMKKNQRKLLAGQCGHDVAGIYVYPSSKRMINACNQLPL